MTFESILIAIETALQHGAALSIGLGYIIAIGLVQWIKRTPWYTDNKWAIRALALPIGFFVTFITWPVHELNAVRFMIALAVGVSSAWVYQGVTFLLYLKWPQLRERLQATPRDT
jgi:hypothetical protein